MFPGLFPQKRTEATTDGTWSDHKADFLQQLIIFLSFVAGTCVCVWGGSEYVCGGSECVCVCVGVCVRYEDVSVVAG